ncbi:MAG: M43 family zinc metalloprotease [Bacteroidota bacterium]
MNLLFRTPVLLVFLLAVFPLFGQQEGIIRCHTVEVEEHKHAQFPELETVEQFETWLAEKLKHPPLQKTQAVITIPIVIHVIHSGENIGSGSNLSNARILSQLDVLNEDFRRESGTPGFNNNAVGADTEIEFCPAVIDPSGSLLSVAGIHRINYQSQNLNAPPFSENYIETVVKPRTIWDPTKYFNMWVLDLAPTSTGDVILGYAAFPRGSNLPQGIPGAGTTASTDGVVMNYPYFGRTGNPNAPYNRGRTATHEVGHWLGLRHIWGDGNCNADDFCSDTPNAGRSNFGCPNNNSCGSRDMVENYMDYTDDACMNIYTQCQKTRMQTVMQNADRRRELLNSTVCQRPTAAPQADFTADNPSGCPGVRVRFQDASTNTPSSWQWSFQGGTPATSTQRNPEVVYNSTGTFDVRLTVTNQNGSDTRTRTGFVTIGGGTSTQVFYQDDFEASTSDWTTINPDRATTWRLASISGSSRTGSQAAGIDLFSYSNRGQGDGLLSPRISLAGRSNVRLQFDHAYRPYSPDEQDSLIVYASDDDGNSYTRLLSLTGNGTPSMATGTIFAADFFPQSDGDWCFGAGNNSCYEVDLSRFDGETQFRILFEAYNDFGNNIYVDNVKLLTGCGPATSLEESAVPASFSVFPNPSTGQFTLRPSQVSAERIHILVVDMMGRKIFNEQFASSNEIQLDLSQVSPGPYLLQFRQGAQIGSKRIEVRR